MTDSAKLLPCPFCGDPMELHFDTIRHVTQGACPIAVNAWSDSAVTAWNTRSLSAPTPTEVGDHEDLASDERWNAGVNYAIERLCEIFGIDPKAINWDAATETLDGDVMSVICNVLVAAYGEEWSSNARQTAAIRTALSTPTEVGEVVAWRGEIPGGVRKFTAIRRVSEIWADQGLAVVPLYASPQGVEVTDEMVERAWHGGRMAIGKPWVTPTEADLIGVRAALTAALTRKEAP